MSKHLEPQKSLVHRDDNGQPATTSYIIAEGTNSQHRAILQLVKQNLSDFEEFGGVAFEMQPFETAGGTQKRTVAVLNREHAMLLMTYMRNTDIIRDFKKRLIRAFTELERRAQQPQFELPQDYVSALRELAASVEAREVAEREAARSAKRLEMAAPKVAKADAHSNVDEWKTRQNFYREVQQWGDAQNLDIKQGSVSELLTRKGMFIGGLRQDRGQLTRSATKAKWGRNHKGVADNGHAYCTPQLSPRGQDIAWKWIVRAVEEHGEKLNPKKETK